jgi:recombination protein RecA
MAKSDKQKALENFLVSNNKKYGDEGAKTVGSNNKKHSKVDVVPTGSILLDDATGIGGFPRGRLIEIYGEEGSGKTSLSVIVAGNAQEKYQDEYVAIVDVEHAINLPYATKLGKLDEDRLVVSQPSAGEQALDEILEMCSSGAFSVIILDSVGGLSTKRQLEKEIGEDTIGEVARLMSNNIKKIADAAHRTNTLVIFINQLRTNIGAYGAPSQTMGGKALRFFASMRIDVKRKEILVSKDKDPIGQNQTYIFKKNRMGIPFKEVETEFFYGKGFNQFKEIIDIALDKGIVGKGGAWFYPNPEDKTFKFQGKEALIEYYSNTPKQFEFLLDKYKQFSETGVITELTENGKETINE